MKGIIIISDNKGKTLAMEQWKNASQRKDFWNTWMKTMLRYDRDGKNEVQMKDYKVGNLDEYKDYSDKQIAFMLEKNIPDRKISSAELRFADRNEIPVDNYRKVKGFITRNIDKYRMFSDARYRTLDCLNAWQSDDKKDICRTQRLFELKEGFNFVADNAVQENADVAWMFRNLADKAVENSFALIQKGSESFILHMGQGNMNTSAIDVKGILYASEVFAADKVWFIHNHPSGNIAASREDMTVWKRLHEVLGEKLQQGIILNTDSGKYGIFNSNITEYRKLDAKSPGRSGSDDYEIPVYAFDRMVFNDTEEWQEAELRNNRDVARFLSTYRFGKNGKFGFLCMDVAGRVRGNFILPKTRLQKMTELAKYITKCCIKSGGMAVLLYGREPEGKKTLQRIPDYLNRIIDQVSAGEVQMVDFVEMKKDGSFLSHDMKTLLHEEDKGYNKTPRRMFEQVEVIPAGGKRNLIRVRVDGEWLPAKVIHAEDVQKMESGTVTKEEIAERYRSKTVQNWKMTADAGKITR